MKVKDIMVSEVIVAKNNETISEVAKRMSQKAISAILIVDKGKPVGIATKTDFLERLLSKGKDPKKTKIQDIMSAPLVTLTPDSGILDALKLMRKTRFSQLPVMSGKKLVGIVALTDLMLFLSTFFSAQKL